MAPLEINQRVLMWLCLYSVDKTTSGAKKMMYVIFTLGALIIISTGMLLSVAFFVKFVSIDLGTALYVFGQIVASGCLLYMFAAMFLSRSKTKYVFDALAGIHRTSKIIFFEFFEDHLNSPNSNMN